MLTLRKGLNLDNVHLPSKTANLQNKMKFAHSISYDPFLYCHKLNQYNAYCCHGNMISPKKPGN